MQQCWWHGNAADRCDGAADLPRPGCLHKPWLHIHACRPRCAHPAAGESASLADLARPACPPHAPIPHVGGFASGTGCQVSTWACPLQAGKYPLHQPLSQEAASPSAACLHACMRGALQIPPPCRCLRPPYCRRPSNAAHCRPLPPQEGFRFWWWVTWFVFLLLIAFSVFMCAPALMYRSALGWMAVMAIGGCVATWLHPPCTLYIIIFIIGYGRFDCIWVMAAASQPGRGPCSHYWRPSLAHIPKTPQLSCND